MSELFSFEVIRQWAEFEGSRTDRINFEWEMKSVKSIVGKPGTEVHFRVNAWGGKVLLKLTLRANDCDKIDLSSLAEHTDQWPAVVQAAMNLRLPLNTVNCLTAWGPGTSSRRTLLHGVTKLQSCYRCILTTLKVAQNMQRRLTGWSLNGQGFERTCRWHILR